MKEVIRYRQPISIAMVRRVGPEGLNINGFFLEAGTDLYPSFMRCLQNNPDTFDWKRWEGNPNLDLNGQHDIDMLLFGGKSDVG